MYLQLRRTKEGVKSELSVPPREEMTIFVPLTPLQRFWYQRLLTKVDTATFNEVFRKAAAVTNDDSKPADSAVSTPSGETHESEDMQILKETVQKTVEDTKKGKSQWQSLMSLLMQLRKICNHPVGIDSFASVANANSPVVLPSRWCSRTLLHWRTCRNGFSQDAGSGQTS